MSMKSLVGSIVGVGGAFSSVASSGSTEIPVIWWIAPLSAVLALVVAFVFYKSMIKESEGTERMKEIAEYVREGAMAYLSSQYKVIFVVFIILFVLFIILTYLGIMNPFAPLAFITGGFFSGLCGYIGMRTATQASARTAHGASLGLNHGLRIAFRSGGVMGLIVVGLGLLNISLWYLFLDKIIFTPDHVMNGLTMCGVEFVTAGDNGAGKLVAITTTMLTFGMGASTLALFARVGGGIYTKAADVGADLVGKVEAGIPEDDPRNPATIADNVGDNVGDVAGMGADLYESYCGSILATSAIGAAVGLSMINDGSGTIETATKLVLAPMIIAGLGIILSIAGIFLVKCKDGATQKNLLNSLLMGTLSSSVLILLATYVLALCDFITMGIFGSVTAGLLSGVIIGQATEYYTSDEYGPTKGIADQAMMGPATTVIDGLAVGMYSSGIPVITIIVGILCAFGFAGGFTHFGMGLYGIGAAAVGMLATLGITLATDAYGPIADNAGGNAEMAELPEVVRERTDALDALGNTTAATGKGFAIGSAALTAMALLAAYIHDVKMWIGKLAGDGSIFGITEAETVKMTVLEFVDKLDLHIMNPLLISGLFLGGMMSFVFCAMTMKAVGRAAGKMVNEVRRQFKEMPGILDGTQTPEYAKCVAISTKGALREMIIPSVLAIVVPILCGLVLGIPGVMGLLVGGLVTGFVLASLLNNAGGAWDNAKKYIERGNNGGKKLEDGAPNPAHAAAVIGDTVGDPCKDTSGPSINILIKLMSMVSIVFIPVVVKLSPIIQKWLGFID